MKRCLHVVLFLFLPVGCAAPGSRSGADPSTAAARAGTAEAPVSGGSYVLLVSFDGFRYDYLDRGLTPTLDSLGRAGVRAERMLPVMPTKTCPNHYTIATGLHAGEHRLVANAFYDPARNAAYSPADRASVVDGTWYGGEPIWVTAQRHGLKSATMFWPGSEAAVQGVHPTYWKRFDAAMPDEARIDTVLSWLRLPDAHRPRLVTLYFEFTDDAGSRYGPASVEADAAIARADSMIARLLAGTRTLAFADAISYVVVSDHGMAAARDVVFLEQYVDSTGVRAFLHGPFASFHAGGDGARLARLRAQLARVPHTRVYDRATLPRAWRWDDPRTGDLVLVAEPYWQIGWTQRAVRPHGAHGWPVERAPEMAGIFVYDRRIRETHRVPGSLNANRLTFPDFVGNDSIVFLVAPQSSRGTSVFRLVCCVR